MRRCRQASRCPDANITRPPLLQASAKSPGMPVPKGNATGKGKYIVRTPAYPKGGLSPPSSSSKGHYVRHAQLPSLRLEALHSEPQLAGPLTLLGSIRKRLQSQIPLPGTCASLHCLVQHKWYFQQHRSCKARLACPGVRSASCSACRHSAAPCTPAKLSPTRPCGSNVGQVQSLYT